MKVTYVTLLNVMTAQGRAGEAYGGRDEDGVGCGRASAGEQHGASAIRIPVWGPYHSDRSGSWHRLDSGCLRQHPQEIEAHTGQSAQAGSAGRGGRAAGT